MFGASGNNFQKTNPVVFNLIALNVVIWLAQVLIKNVNLTDLGAMHYFKSPDFKPYQVVTSMFMHSVPSPMHLFFNMICLYFFGTMLESVWGSKRFLLFYLICGVAANILTQFTIPFTSAAMVDNILATAESIDAASREYYVSQYIDNYSSLGASGALMGVLAAAAYLFPNTPVMIMFIPIPIKLKYIVLIYAAYDLFGGLSNSYGTNIGHFAHLFGGLIGFLLVLYWNKTNKKTFY